jgi:hypothetical protein
VIRSHHTEESAADKVAKRLARTATGRAIFNSPDYQTLEQSRSGDELADALLTITDHDRRGVVLRAYFFGEVDARPRRSASPHKPSIARQIKQAEETGKTVTSIVTPDGTTINFDEPKPSDANNPWLADLKVRKQ